VYGAAIAEAAADLPPPATSTRTRLLAKGDGPRFQCLSCSLPELALDDALLNEPMLEDALLEALLADALLLEELLLEELLLEELLLDELLLHEPRVGMRLWPLWSNIWSCDHITTLYIYI